MPGFTVPNKLDYIRKEISRTFKVLLPNIGLRFYLTGEYSEMSDASGTFVVRYQKEMVRKFIVLFFSRRKKAKFVEGNEIELLKINLKKI